MKNLLSKLDKNVLAILEEIGHKADEQKIAAYVVGGFVRDILLKRRNVDIDVVVEGDALFLAKMYAQQHQASLTIHDRFGTAVVKLADEYRVDFAAARKEKYLHPGALPVVENGTIRDDLFRRDFSINAMAVRINRDSWAQLADEFGGLEDLKKRKIRILHEKSFIDDPTRILRAVRFEQRFRFTVEPKTKKLLVSALDHKLPLQVKDERYFAEFKKILFEESPLPALKRLAQVKGLSFLLANGKVDLSFLGKVAKTVAAVKKKYLMGEVVDWWLVYFMALLKNCSQLSVKQIFIQFNLRRIDRDKILLQRKVPEVVNIISRKTVTPAEVYTALKPLSYENQVFVRAVCPSPVAKNRIDAFWKKYDKIELSINGTDLKEMGIPEGEQIRIILNRILLKKVDGKIRTREQELKEAERLKVVV